MTAEGTPLPVAIQRLEQDFTSIGRPAGPDFETTAGRIVSFQRERIPLYDRYLESLGGGAPDPHIPIRAFREARLSSYDPAQCDAVFVSSGTSGSMRSRHYVHRLAVYEASIRTNFEHHFGAGPYTIIAHLPGYDDADGSSSLLYMVRCLIRNYGDEESGFFLGRPDRLRETVEWSARYDTRLMLFGVAFGLLDLAEEGRLTLPDTSLVIETGGMKTRRREIARDDLHHRLAAGFGVPRTNVLSEYGMTELLSQCYTRGQDLFYPPAWMTVEVRNPDNPLENQNEGEPGLLAIFDIANMYSVSGILTEDLGERHGDGFRVLGRLQGAAMRGCNMLLEGLE